MISFLSKIIKLSNLNVVGIIRNDYDVVYRVLAVRKKGNKIEIISCNSFNSQEELFGTLNNKVPLILVIDGKGVLNKEIDFNVESDVNWHKNVDFSTIYHTSLKSSRSSFMSFCRKKGIQDMIAKFSQHSFQVADIYVGSFLSALLQASVKKETILSNDLLLAFEDGKLSGYSKQHDGVKKEEYTIGTDVVSSAYLPLYSVLVHFFLQSPQVSKTKDETLNVEEIIYKKIFNVFGIAMVAGFFLSLLSSYLLIQYYGSQNAALNLQNVYSSQSYQLLVDLEKQKADRQELLRETGLLSSKYLSYYAYDIMRKIPTDIVLNEISILPLKEEIKQNKKLDFETGTIVVKGETNREASFESWMESLRQMEWLKDFEIISLKKDKKNKSRFELKITVKDV